MSASKLKTFSLALLVTVGVASAARAQLDEPNSPFYGPSNDLRFFEPVDLDIDSQSSAGPTGFFFGYDKLSWVTLGERVEVGDPDTEQRMFRQSTSIPLDPNTGNPIIPPTLPNSIQNAVPRAHFTNGDRYEFGFWGEDNNGWLMGVLIGPDDTQNFTIGQDGGSQGGFQDGNRLPIGDVYVAFRTDPGLLAGFIDLHEDAVGPGGGILPDDDNGDGTLDGNGISDDLNNNGVYGNDGIPGDDDDFLAVPPDYGDMVYIPISFGVVNIRNSSKLNGFELMRGHRMDNSHYMVKHQNNRFEWQYGARFLQMDDNFFFDGLGVTNADWSIGDTQIDQSIVNNIVGPQLGYKWIHTRGRWSLDSVGKFMFGYNIRDWSQRGFIAEDATPSRPNQPLYIVPHSFSYGRSDSGFSPTAELRLNLNYRVTDNIQMGFGYTGTFVDNIRRASTHVDYVLHENDRVMGFRNVDVGESLLSNGFNFHVEITQ